MLNALRNKFIFISLNPIGIMANNVGIKNKTISKYKFKFNKILKSSGLKLSGIRLSDRGSWNLTVNDSIHIAVGRSKLTSRLERFIKLYETNGFNEDYRNSEIDLRYENGIAAKKLTEEFTELVYR